MEAEALAECQKCGGCGCRVKSYGDGWKISTPAVICDACQGTGVAARAAATAHAAEWRYECAQCGRTDPECGDGPLKMRECGNCGALVCELCGPDHGGVCAKGTHVG